MIKRITVKAYGVVKHTRKFDPRKLPKRIKGQFSKGKRALSGKKTQGSLF